MFTRRARNTFLTASVAAGLAALFALLTVSPPAPAGAGGADPSAPGAGSSLMSLTATVFVARDGLLGVQEPGTTGPVAFVVDSGALIARDGAIIPLGDLRPGEFVRLTVDRRTNQAVAVAVTAAARRGPSDLQALLAGLGFVAGAMALVVRNRPGVAQPIVPTPGPTARLRRIAVAMA